MMSGRCEHLARAANLLVPGGGLILVGQVAGGVIVALLFALLANLSAAATLLFPDDVPALWRAGLLGVTAGVYLGAQVRLAQTLREGRTRARLERRNQALRLAREHLLRGEAQAAWEVLQPVLDLADSDLLVAYRAAQVLTACGDAQAARQAWERLRRIDRHRIYRREIEQHIQAAQHGAAGPSGV